MRACAICVSSQRSAIEAAMAGEPPTLALAHTYGVTLLDLRRHKHSHLEEAEGPARPAGPRKAQMLADDLAGGARLVQAVELLAQRYPCLYALWATVEEGIPAALLARRLGVAPCWVAERVAAFNCLAQQVAQPQQGPRTRRLARAS